jgi:thiamine biosynthesis protein ThiI
VDKRYPLDSMEMAAELGARILDAYEDMKVDVHNPEILLNVEIREKLNIFSEVIPGPGGMPIGTAGKAMLLLSGGIDSPVAGYMVAKRGVDIEAVYFNAPPYTSEKAKQKVVDLAGVIAKYTGKVKLHVINFTDIQMYIYEKCPHEELTIIMRRYMMRIADMLAGESGCMGLITGESIGQVASQTMQSLICTGEVVTDIPVYRPLIAFDKQDIVDISYKIDAYETSILPYEDCCTIFVAKHPVTKPRADIIRRHEELLNEKIDELVKVALETDEVIEITK